MKAPADADVNAINVRPMTTDDIDAVLKMELEVFSEPFDRRTFENIVAEDVAFAKWVSEKGDEIVAYAACTLGLDESDLITIAVAEGYRRKGVASQLLAHASSDLAARGVKQLFLEVRPSNEAAKSFYFRHGFRQISVRKKYYRNGEDALVMVLSLDKAP